MDNISPEKCKQVVKDILSKSICTVCSNILQPPVISCINGHVFCEKCLPTPFNCRLCPGQFVFFTHNNELLDSIVDILPHKCRYEGCSVFVTSGDDHEERCGHKLMTCDAAKSERVDSGEAIEHIIQDHEANPIDNISPEKCKQVVKDILSKTRCMVCSNILQPPVRVCINGHGFCEKCLSRRAPLKCPLCPGQFLLFTHNNVLLDSIVDLLPHKCRYDGCSVFVTSGDEREERCGHKLMTHDAANHERADSGQAIEHIIQDHEANPIDNLTLEDWKKLHEKILKRVSCPVCYNILRPPVAVCGNGHSTCPDCKSKLSTCPLCKTSFLKMEIRQLDDVLEVIPHLCRFEGCQVFVKMDDDHETWCGYRKIDCKMRACKWEGCVRGLAEHCRKDHKALKNEKNENWMYTNIDPCKAMSNIYKPILAYGQFFWMHTTNDYTEKIFKIAYYCVPDEKIVDSFQITVILKKDNKKYSTSILMLPENSRNEDENCICLHSSFVQTFVNSERKLFFSSHIEKK